MTVISPQAWRNAILAVFAANGFAVATLLSRLPGLRDHLGIEPGQLGLLLLSFSVGSVGGLTFAGHLVHFLGNRRAMRIMLSSMGVTLALVGLASGWLESIPATVVAGMLFGGTNGINDVAMNVDGAANERALGRHVMPWFHAGFSGGTIAGAGLGSLAAALDVPIGIHLSLVGLVVSVVALVATGWMPDVEEQADEDRPTFRDRMAVWTERRTLLVGVLVLGFAYAEGSANDWLAVGLIDERNLTNAQGALMLMVFTIAMTAGRVAGPSVLDRFGRLPVLLATAVLALIGLSIVIFVPVVPIVVVGVVLWGLGSCLGFPVGMSAAADDPAHAAARVSAVALVGYLAFLVGPPLVGFVANGVGTLHALVVVLGLIVLAALTSPAARPVKPG